MRISDWSSDVCSSDLQRYRFFAGVASVENLLMPAKKYVIFYRPDPSNFEKAGELFPAHVEHYEAFQQQGTLLSFGPFEDIVKNGSMGIFTTMERSEEHTSELQSTNAHLVCRLLLGIDKETTIAMKIGTKTSQRD